MKTLNKKYVDFSKWTGKIYRVSSVPSDNSIHTTIEMRDNIIQDIHDDKRSLESAYIGFDSMSNLYKAYNKTGTIHFPKPESNFIEISTDEKNPDISLILYTNNKLLEIFINYKAVRSWYNHRMKDGFNFASGTSFIFEIRSKKSDELLKTINIKPSEFLENFECKVDLVNINNLNDIKILTKRIVEVYNLEIQANKYIKVKNNDNFQLNKIDTGFKNIQAYDLVIYRTNIKNILYIKNNIENLNIKEVYKDINLYVTGSDPNKLYEILCIPLIELWNKNFLTIEFKSDLVGKIIWCEKILKILFNEKVIEL